MFDDVIKSNSNLTLKSRFWSFSNYVREWQRGGARSSLETSGLKMEYIDPYIRRYYFHDPDTEEIDRNSFHHYLCEFVIQYNCDPTWHLPIVLYLEKDGCVFDVQEQLLADTLQYRDRGLFEFSNELMAFWGMH